MVYFGWLTLGVLEFGIFHSSLHFVFHSFLYFHLWKLQNAVKIVKHSMLVRLLNLVVLGLPSICALMNCTFYLPTSELAALFYLF